LKFPCCGSKIRADAVDETPSPANAVNKIKATPSGIHVAPRRLRRGVSASIAAAMWRRRGKTIVMERQGNEPVEIREGSTDFDEEVTRAMEFQKCKRL
jgi:hypothetical protein